MCFSMARATKANRQGTYKSLQKLSTQHKQQLHLDSQYMKMRNVHTAATRESLMVSIDFFLFIAESMLFTCKIIQKVVHQTPEFQVKSIHV